MNAHCVDRVVHATVDDDLDELKGNGVVRETHLDHAGVVGYRNLAETRGLAPCGVKP